ncbi:uncharacterized protein F54H12.2-like [Stegodyphus dumicola]|uniref:uncharacterized protein F54H12.2-like n=1 Tax=Stegodyphus dumicola TaxID=202533 RepID=UPI0015AFB9F0|nr:uncharacterized protein F54H12.2-like [Stegodyphus dumicola]
MAFLLKDSPECAKSELNLFTLPPTQTVIERGQWIEFHPLANVTDGSPVEFNVAGSGDDYLDLSQTQLYVKVKILKSNGASEKMISNNTYPYRAMIEKLLNHGFDTKTSQLSSELYFKDTAGRMNVFDTTDKQPNEGFNKRAEIFKLSATVDMIGRLHLDMFHQERLLLNMVDMKIKLIRSKPEFCLLGEENFKVSLEHVSLFVRKVRVSPGVILGHAKSLEKATAKYPINRVLCKVYSIPSGNMSLSKIHNHINFIGIYVDGQPVPHNPLQPDFMNKTFIRAYQNLFTNAENRGLYLSRSEYPEGYCLFLFDLSPDLCDGSHLNLVRHSNLRLEVKFGFPLPITTSVIVYAEFENLIEINKSRNIIYDFGN